MNLKHRNVENDVNVIKCRTCGECFSAKWNLMKHRKNMHSETVALCRNYIIGKCTYSDDMCWWNHRQEKHESIKCFICNNIFESKMLLMRHRKKDHTQFVKTCNNSTQNNCRFQDDDCWFMHESNNDDNNDEANNQKSDAEDNLEPVFQDVSEDLAPPIQNRKKVSKQTKPE